MDPNKVIILAIIATSVATFISRFLGALTSERVDASSKLFDWFNLVALSIISKSLLDNIPNDFSWYSHWSISLFSMPIESEVVVNASFSWVSACFESTEKITQLMNILRTIY